MLRGLPSGFRSFRLLVTRTNVAHRLGCRLTLFAPDLEMAEPLLDGRGTAAATGMETLHVHAAANLSQLDDELVDVELMIVFSIRDRAFQRLFDLLGDAALAEGEISQSAPGRQVTDRCRDQVQLARANPHIAG